MGSAATDRWNNCHDYVVPHVRIRQVAKLVQLERPATVIDLGCHDGQLGRLLEEVTYTGCDFVTPDRPDFSFVLCDFNHESLPSTLPVADVVVASGVLEYVENLPRLLTEIRDHISANGAFVATYFNMNHLSRAVRLAAGRSFPVHPDWRGFYARRDFRRMLGDAGFVIEREFASTGSFRASPAAGDTQNLPPTLHRTHRWSDLLAHQFIYLARPAAAVNGDRSMAEKKVR
jgi:SAM-dependent methyltransferase